MVNLHLRYVIEDVDRHGNRRFYFRRRGREFAASSKVRLPGEPGSKEFMDAYQSALTNAGTATNRTGFNAGSFGSVCQAYYASAIFKALSKHTQSWRRRVLDEICRDHGDKPIAKMEPKHVRVLRDEKESKPAASQIRLKALRSLFRWAIEADLTPSDPTRDVKRLPYVAKGHHSWTLDDVAAYEACHPIGSKARLALAIMLCTGCRRGDVVRLGPQHISGGRLRYRQSKNENRKPIDVDIPVLPDLSAIVGETPSGHLSFLVTEYGKPFSAAGFGNKFRDWCNQAGLQACSAHGLRKALCARLAERGATPHEIMAISGHRTLEEVERYTRAASNVLLANSGMARLTK
jgi:integrase/recombinase XerD